MSWNMAICALFGCDERTERSKRYILEHRGFKLYFHTKECVKEYLGDEE